MNEEITKIENCLKAMKKCLKIPHVESCICFSDAFKVLNLEVNRLQNTGQSIGAKERINAIKDEIEKIKKKIYSQDKECLGCSLCMAAIVFKAYPERLESLYLENEL